VGGAARPRALQPAPHIDTAAGNREHRANVLRVYNTGKSEHRAKSEKPELWRVAGDVFYLIHRRWTL